MNINEAWKNFIDSGSPLEYIKYSKIKTQEEMNAENKQGLSNKGNGCQGK